ncbi:hypothetical protein J4Q44_G00229330 [Coregonus suidteri]|uniref:Uncharacterized protein n=1 Tax=Coregonus suidteri TaxID=861788 RepID=A0AAN8LAD8_9TELE
MSGEEIITTYMHMEVREKIVLVGKSLSSDQPVIYVRDMQETEKVKHKVTVYKMQRDSNSVALAFCFLYENQPFFFVVKGNDVKLEKITDVKTACSDVRCLFQWNEKSGEWGNLKSVAEPQKYLRIVDNKVTLGTWNQVVEFRLNSK